MTLRQLIFVVLVVAAPPVWPAVAADMPAGPPRELAERTGPVDAAAATEKYLQRRAALLLLRARFDVIGAEDVLEQLVEDARRLATTGPTEIDEEALDVALLSEGSYALVSLKYLVESGGALWPSDRVERAYVDDAIVLLTALQAELLRIIDRRDDPLPVLEGADRIYWWTEGFSQPPAASSAYGERDSLASLALAAAGNGRT